MSDAATPSRIATPPQTGPGLVHTALATVLQSVALREAQMHPLPALTPTIPTGIAVPAGKSRLRPRHHWLLASFVCLVLAPVMVSAWYLWARAADQFVSVTGFSIHREDDSPAAALLGGLGAISASTSPDADILYQYMMSQDLVAELDGELDLRAMWSRPVADPVFAYAQPGSIETLVDYWRSMVSLRHDGGARLIEVQVRAFAPGDAQTIAAAILEKSSAMINRMNDVAAEDSQRHARAELARALVTLTAARGDVVRFRTQHRSVDPGMDLAVQSGAIAVLQQELIDAEVHLDMLRATTIATDQRLPQAERRVRVIKAQIDAKSPNLGQGAGSDGATGYAALLSEYEGLTVERQFAEKAYLAARTAFELSRADAVRQSRYLAAHVLPTLAESARHPARLTLLAMITAFVLALWLVGALVYYSLHDRR